MPTNVTPAGVFTDPVTRPTDGDPGNGTTFQQPIQALTDRTQFLADQLGGNTGLGEWTYKGGTRTRIVAISLYDAILDWDLAGTPGWSRPTNPAGSVYSLEGGVQKQLVVPISKYLRDGMKILSVRMLCEPGDNPSADPTMSLGLYYGNPTLDPLAIAIPAPTGVGSLAASSGSDLQVVVMSIGGGGHSVVRYTSVSNRSRDYYLHIVGTDSTGGSSSNHDFVYGLGLELADTGPGGG